MSDEMTDAEELAWYRDREVRRWERNLLAWRWVRWGAAALFGAMLALWIDRVIA